MLLIKENELYVVKEYKFDNPLITDIVSIIDSCFKDFQNISFHNFKYKCIYDIKHTNITDFEIFSLTISGKSMNWYDLKEKLKFARHNGFILNQLNKLTINFYSQILYINIGYYLKVQKPMCHRQFFRVIPEKSRVSRKVLQRCGN